jgi:hypothetical protein
LRYSTIHEYNKELREYFETLEETNPEVLEGLGVKEDFDGFIRELAMIGMRKLKEGKS